MFNAGATPLLDPAPPSSELRPRAETDWAAFLDSYGRAMLDWLRQAGLPQVDLDETLRELLAECHREFKLINSDDCIRFRPWLQFTAHTAWRRITERVTDASAKSLKAELFCSSEAHDSFLNHLDAACSQYRRRDAMERLATQTDAGDWMMFQAVVVDNASSEDTAAAHGMSLIAVESAIQRTYVSLSKRYAAIEEFC